MLSLSTIDVFTLSVLRTWKGDNAHTENGIIGLVGEFGEMLEQQHAICSSGLYIRQDEERKIEEVGDFLYYYHALCWMFGFVPEYVHSEVKISLNVNIIGSVVFISELADAFKKNCFHEKSNELEIVKMLKSVPEKVLYANGILHETIQEAMDVNRKKIDWKHAELKSKVGSND